MRLTNGAKETFGWVIVGSERDITIPPGAWKRYGFLIGEHAYITPGSQKSGGFGITNKTLLEKISIPGFEDQILGISNFTAQHQIHLPPHIPFNPRDRLLSIFGSGFVLGIVSKGPIFDFARQHPELDEFT